MRKLQFFLTSIVMLFAGVISVESQGINEKDVSKLVDEYVAGKTTDGRKADIELKLLQAKPALSTKAIKAALGREKDKAKALGLAILLWTPGVFKSVQSGTGSELCPQIVRLGLTRQDKGAPEYLFDRWNLAALDSKEFESISLGFKTWYVDLPIIDKLKAVIESPAAEAVRKTVATEILVFQLGLGVTATQDLLDTWETAREAREKDGRRFPMEGRDLSTGPGWNLLNARHCGANVVLTAPEQDVAHFEVYDTSFVPKELQKGSWRVNIRILLRSDDCEVDCSVAELIHGTATGPLFKVRNKKWMSPTAEGDGDTFFPVKANVWVTLTYVIKDISDAKNPKKRTISQYLDGKALSVGFDFSSEWHAFDITITKGEAVLSGVEILPE